MDKTSHGGPGTRDRIYSWSTYHAYRRWVGAFLDHCRENGRPTDLASCRQYAGPWIRSMAEGGKYSAWTLNLARSAVAKLYGESGDRIAHLPPRRREDITRSRGGVAMDNRIRDEWRPLMDFCRATGLRRHELEKLRGTDLSQPPGGPPRLEVKGKGGKVRSAPVVGDPGAVQAVVEACISAGRGLVWPEVPEKLDIHSLRAEYAEAVYRAAERPLGSLKGHELYHCRGDRVGIAYDREALRAASAALGHGRVSVVADHYLWGPGYTRCNI